MRQGYASRARGDLAALCVGWAALLAACGGGGGGGGEPSTPAQPPTAQAGTVSLNVLGAAASTVSGKVAATDPQSLALTYTLATAPTAGTVALDARTGDFTYTLPGHTSASQDTFTVSVSNGRSTPATATVTVRLAGDPLLVNQWHIRNTGATAFSTTPPVTGNDMNVAGAWAAGFSGRGVKVGIVDSGLEIAHEDLAANVDAASSFNFLTGGSDPTRAADDVGSDHGTMVAGIVGAAAFNGKGGRGVAFGARLRGYNLFANFSAANYAAAMGGAEVSADNAVFNASFSIPSTSLAPVDQAYIAANAHLNTLRGGLGAILVNSSGNEFESLRGADASRCTAARAYGVSCGDPAQDTRRGGTTPIIVGALNAEGRRSSYSTTGSSLWVAAPGGEFGFDSNYSRAPNLSAERLKPAIVTTARSGCANRMAAPDIVNALASGNHPMSLNCQYTAQMNGTSSAAPNAAATVALMLEANPRLSARDVKFILARTARQVDAGLRSITATDVVPGASVTLEQGWVRNSAGYWFSNWYGFGAVDAGAAVTMARSYTGYLPPATASNPYATTPRQGVEVPAMSTSGYVISAAVDESFSTIEQVVVFVNLEGNQPLTCTQIEVTSPSGTRSILLHAANGFVQTSVDTRILSNAFYGEPAKGTWKLTYFNFCEGQTRLSATKPQQIIFVGR